MTGYKANFDKDKTAPHPTNVSKEDRWLGAIVGNAVGDALGAPLEFRSREHCLSLHPEGIQEMLPGGPTGGKGAGSYTDDTEMLVAIGEAALIAKGTNLDEIGKQFANWLKAGPPDIGGQTRATVGDIARGGIRASESGWAHNHSGSLGNGSLMRNGIVYVLTSAAPLSQRIYAAEQISCITHAGRECRSACAAMTFLQIALEQLTPQKAIKETLKFMKETWGSADKTLMALMDTIEEKRDITEVDNTGYVTGTLERALWPLWRGLSFEEAVIACVMQGGDADTAGAVCGSLMGTAYGAQAIPQRWLESVYVNEAKHRTSKGRPGLRRLAQDLPQISSNFYGYPTVTEEHDRNTQSELSTH